jgi:hypothetical protein
MRTLRTVLPTTALLTVLALTLAPTAAPAQPSVADPTYTALRAARPDGRVLLLSRPLTLERDALRFDFESGAFHFLAPVAGRTPGAVFIGQGRYQLTPAIEDERRHLGFVLGQPDLQALTDRFDRLLLLFGDDTEAELGLAGSIAPLQPDAAAIRALAEALRWQRKELRTNLHLRLLHDLLDTPGLTSGVFLALVDGQQHPPALLAVDPAGAEALRLAPLMGGEDTVVYVADEVRGGFWYLADRIGEVASGHRSGYRPRFDALHYEVATEIQRDTDLVGTTTIHLRVEQPARVVPIHLASTLRLQGAEYRPAGGEGWTAVPFVQEERLEDADAAVVLPERLPKGAELELRLAYRGNEVLFDLGFEVFAVGARESWYPNLGVFRDPATFELTYRVPKDKEVVSVGRRVRVGNEGGLEVSVWRAEQPIRVAGFNYGRFRREAQRDQLSGLEVEVYSNRRAVEMLGRSTTSEIADTIVSAGDLAFEGGIVAVAPSQSAGRQNVSAAAMADGLNAARLFHTYFGPLPQSHVAITQQAQFFFGQSWPSLIFLPYQSFMSGTARNTVGLTGFGADQFVEQVGHHEMAHQWWGHLVGWDSYRDQWLSEGFAEFSAALAVQHVQGWDAYAKVWKEARDRIVGKAGSVMPIYQVGPISRGFRLSHGRSQLAYPILAYSKGGFVLHMLRMMMWDASSPQPEQAFIALMRDFTATYAGKAPSTEDFKRVVERHVVPALDATGDGKVDWFFDQWVYGTDVPRLSSKLQARKLAGDEYQITGEVTVSDVPDGFRVMVPLYVEFPKGRLGSFARLPFAGSGTRKVDLIVRLPEKPKRLLVNARWEVLARD